MGQNSVDVNMGAFLSREVGANVISTYFKLRGGVNEGSGVVKIGAPPNCC